MVDSLRALKIIQPLGVDDAYFVSLTPDDANKVSVATMHEIPTVYSTCHEFGPALLGAGNPRIKKAISLLDPNSILMSTSTEVDVSSKGQKDQNSDQHSLDFINQNAPRKAEFTSALSFASAQAMSKILSLFTNGGEVGGVRIISEETAISALSDTVFDNDGALMLYGGITQGGLGDMSSFKDSENKYGPDKELKGFYGWTGMGGSFNFIHPEKKVTVSYAMTALGNQLIGDPRSDVIMKAVAKVTDQLNCNPINPAAQ